MVFIISQLFDHPIVDSREEGRRPKALNVFLHLSYDHTASSGLVIVLDDMTQYGSGLTVRSLTNDEVDMRLLGEDIVEFVVLHEMWILP